MNSYDPESHVYRNDRVRLPGATDVIKSHGLIDPTWMSEDARWRGKCVHRGIELLNRQQLDWDTVDELVQGYLLSYQAFLEISKFQIIGAEDQCFDTAFACTPDLWGTLNGYRVIIELKTGTVPKWAALQTALQAHALWTDRGFRAAKRFGLQLRADGRISKLIPFENLNDERVAMSMVDTFWWRVENGYMRDWNVEKEDACQPK